MANDQMGLLLDRWCVRDSTTRVNVRSEPPRNRGAMALGAAGMTKEAALLQFNSVPTQASS